MMKRCVVILFKSTSVLQMKELLSIICRMVTYLPQNPDVRRYTLTSVRDRMTEFTISRSSILDQGIDCASKAIRIICVPGWNVQILPRSTHTPHSNFSTSVDGFNEIENKGSTQIVDIVWCTRALAIGIHTWRINLAANSDSSSSCLATIPVLMCQVVRRTKPNLGLFDLFHA